MRRALAPAASPGASSPIALPLAARVLDEPMTWHTAASGSSLRSRAGIAGRRYNFV
jgi:hypothetical protein